MQDLFVEYTTTAIIAGCTIILVGAALVSLVTARKWVDGATRHRGIGYAGLPAFRNPDFSGYYPKWKTEYLPYTPSDHCGYMRSGVENKKT